MEEWMEGTEISRSVVVIRFVVVRKRGGEVCAAV